MRYGKQANLKAAYEDALPKSELQVLSLTSPREEAVLQMNIKDADEALVWWIQNLL